MNTDMMAANIFRVWQDATNEETAEGRAWYGQAHAIARDLSLFDPRRAAYVLAALSPRQAWSRNVALARQAYALAAEACLRDPKRPSAVADAILANLPTLGLQRRQVAALLAYGEDPDQVVKGTKTNAFARTIADPSDPSLVVVDRHALSIAYGSAASGGDLSLTDKRYRAIADAYRDVAAVTGELPSTVQAVTWVAWRRRYGHAMARVAAGLDNE